MFVDKTQHVFLDVTFSYIVLRLTQLLNIFLVYTYTGSYCNSALTGNPS